MSKAAMNLQDSFLNQVRRENSEVRVLLVNGTTLRGIVKEFDNFTLILNNRSGQHLIYKHAVAQILSHRPHGKPDDAAAGDSTGDHTDHSGDALAGVLASADTSAHAGSEKPHSSERQPRSNNPRRERDNKARADQSKQKKEGFNTIDLSAIKLGEK